MENQQQIVRMAKTFGNGAHIFVPKEWVGEQIVIIKPKKKSIKERIIESLEPYLESIVGAYLYGSHARDEQVEDSDIDLLVITNKKVKIKREGFEIVCLEEKKISKAIELEPLLIYSVLSEAKPIINSRLLDEFRTKYIPKLGDFEEYFKDCERIIKINEEFLESANGDFLSSEAVIYSLVLRLRGVFIIKSILKGDKYTNKSFKSWIKLPQVDVDSIYDAYRDSKNEKKVKQKIKVTDIQLLLEFLKNELHMSIDGKKREKTQKRD